jgi:CHAD domain-containing protein
MPTVSDVVLSSLETLHTKWGLVRDGDVEGIHDARVATRRLRAALPLLGSGRFTDSSDDMASTVKALGRALGKARDKDEALRLVGDIEQRSPSTAPAAAVLRARLLPERVRQRRRLIKALEAADVEGLEQLRKAVHHEAWRSGRHLWRRRGSPSGLAAVIAERAEILEQRIDHASGVYFPNRAHKVRVAMKKLRYAVEFLDGTEKIRKPSVRVLRRAQEALGQVHDREVLRQRLTSLAKDEDIPAARELERVLEAETRAIFETYRAMRPALLAVCTELAAWSRQGVGHARARLLLVGAVALPSAAVLLATRARRAS